MLIYADLMLHVVDDSLGSDEKSDQHHAEDAERKREGKMKE